MTESEKVICKMYLEDLDKNHSCNEYKLLMGLLEQETCEDCISRQEVKSKMQYYGFHAPDMTISEFVEDLPSIQPARRKGKWILAENGWNTVCGSCGKGKWKGYIPTPEEAADWMPICPQCGTDMRKE